MKITPTTHRALMATLSQHGLHPRRHAVCWEASGHKTESSKELTEAQARHVIQTLNDKANKVRRKMMAIAGKMKWGVTHHELLAALDWWCLNRTSYKKHLMKMTMEELTKVCTILETKVYPDYLKGLSNGDDV